MIDFLKIYTFFTQESERSLESLKLVYNNSNLLKNTIHSLIKCELIDNNLIAGKNILLKPNWVLHDRKDSDAWCMRTHSSVLLALLEVLLSEKPQIVTIGDAPVQSCDWDRMLPDSFYIEVARLSNKYGIQVLIKDFRRVTFSPDKNKLVQERNPLSEYLIFDLGHDSFLEDISKDKKNNFRVTSYNPDRIAQAHSKGVHKYCISKEAFKADLVISLPKLKTHQKTGITAALKNIVGINGDKDFLPHHRIGGTGFGGDCYPGKSYLRFISEKLLDQANRNQGKYAFWVWTYLSAFFWKFSRPQKVHHIAAAWHGNDTTWRMVMDLNRIMLYGKSDGSISTIQQRKLFSLGDGIIGGQGDGPLSPVPLPLGIITFTDNSAIHDIGTGILMGFPPGKISLLKAALNSIKSRKISVFVNGNQSSLNELSKWAIKTLPPPGWVEYLSISDKNQSKAV